MINRTNAMRAKLEHSNVKIKKYAVTIYNKYQMPVLVNFGARGYNDYTTLTGTPAENEKRRQAYIARHGKRIIKTKYHTRWIERAEDWHNPYTAGFWARWLLWEKPTIEEAKKNITLMFDIEFI
jgi:hypothetical protein